MHQYKPVEAASLFIDEFFPQCQGAILAGSVVRGEATDTSDLDIVIFDNKICASYRESLIQFGWPIEVFVHNLTSYQSYFDSDVERARPSLPRMVAEGIILKDEGIIESIKLEAIKLLDKGPAEWSIETINFKRYFLTDTLDDFIGCTNRAEELFIANHLAELASEFVLRTNRQWIGSSKWIVRALKQYDQKFTNRFMDAFDGFYRTGEKENVIKIVEEILVPFGGTLFEGFSLGKK
ncbi:MAG: nucleotidyltransferase domain-containing protein [Rummeliibacillus sp.]